MLAKAVRTAATGTSVAVALALLLPMEAGVPIPIPSDLLMLFIGQRAGAGRIPLWIAALGLEAVTAAGTLALFFLVGGPGRSMLLRIGPRLGLTPERMSRVERVLERRGRNALFVGRTTPGLRTVTVVAAAASGIPAARALPPLLLGSTLFIQGHLLLGFLLGPLAETALKRAQTPILVAVVLLAAAGVVLWIVRRGRTGGAQAWTEASCPACLAIAAFAGRRDAP